MANDLTQVAPRLLAQGLMALREVCFMPSLVNRGYDDMAGRLGSTVDVPLPSSIALQVVNPSNVPPSVPDITPTVVSIPLNNWFEAPFYLTDQDLLVCMDGTIPMQASEAIKTLANRVNRDILATYKDFYGYIGTAGATPIATNTSDIVNVRKTLHRQLCPVQDRRFVLDPDAEGNALNLGAFQQFLQSNDASVMREGQIGRKFGFDFYMHQLIPTHTAGTHGGGTITLTATTAAGTSTRAEPTSVLGFTVTGGTGLSYNVGDIITLAGDTQTYVVTTAVAIAAAGTGNVTVAPQLALAHTAGDAVTLKASHVANIAFHRDAIAFATRPLTETAQGLGNIIESTSDPESQLTLRLEISREHKQTKYSFDMLYGVKTIRRELGCRLAG